MKNYKELVVWQKSIELVSEIYLITRQFPKEERFGLSSQMQRAAIAIASNIAEGARRNYTTEYIQFLGIANGSSAELETQLIIARKLYSDFGIDFSRAEALIVEVLKMLNSLIPRLKNKLPTTP